MAGAGAGGKCRREEQCGGLEWTEDERDKVAVQNACEQKSDGQVPTLADSAKCRRPRLTYLTMPVHTGR